MASFTWEGDFTTAAKWYPYAVTEIASMKLTGQMGNVKTVTPEPGVMIMMQTNPFHIHIIAESGLYLESGFFAISNTALNNASSYKSEPLYLTGNTFLSTEAAKEAPMLGLSYPGENSDGDPFHGGYSPDNIKLENGYTSLALGGGEAEALDEIVLSETVYSGGPYYEILRELKLAQRFSPSSIYSGKMRLLVQSLYGQIRTDYSLTSGDLNIPGLTFDGKALGFEGHGSAGLYTTKDYKYYIVEFGNDETLFTPLKLRGEAQSFLNVASDTSYSDEDRAKAEAYAFVGVTIDHDAPVIIKQGVEVIGSPLGYGWHFNTMGNEARIVCHQLDTDGNHKNISREYKVTIDHELNVTSVLEKTSDWYRDKSFIPWSVTYFPSLANVQRGEHSDAYHNISDAGLYGCYDGDTYKRCALTVIVNNSPTDSDSGFPYADPFYESDCGEWKERTRTVTTYTSSLDKYAGTCLLSFGATEVTGDFNYGITSHKEGTYKKVQVRGDSTPSEFLNDTHKTCGGTPIAEAIGWELGGDGLYRPIITDERVEFRSHSVSVLSTVYTNPVRIYKSLLALSFYDCNHLVLGELDDNSYDSKIVEWDHPAWAFPTSDVRLGHFFEYRVWHWPFLPEGREIKYTGPMLWHAGPANNFLLSVSSVSGVSDISCELDSERPVLRYANSIDDGYHLESDSVTEGVITNWMTNHFYPDLLLPLAYTTFIARGTYGGADKMRFVDKDIFTQTNENGYLEDYESGVGWI